MTDEVLIGRLLLDRFRIAGHIGNGGMAEVYRATDVETGGAVAVKLLHRHLVSEPAFSERLRREADAVAQISHPHIVRLFGQGELDGRPFLVLELVDGITLAELLARGVALAPERAVAIIRDVLGALQHAHALGLIHRDVKPQNILLTRQGRAKVTDFGIAQTATTATLSHTGEILGSVHYLAPERLLGHLATPASDVYSVGVVLYQMLTGRLPFVGDVPAIVASQHAQRPPSPPSMLKPGLPAWLNRAVMRALAKHPSERFSTAEAMLRALEPSRFGAAGGNPVLVTGRRFKGMAYRTRRTIPRNLVALGLVVVLTVLGVVAGRELWDARVADALASSNLGALPSVTPRVAPTSDAAVNGVPARPTSLADTAINPNTSSPTGQTTQRAAMPVSSNAFQQVGIVWPHDGQGNAVGLDRARAVNVSLWPRVQVDCDVKPANGVLWLAQNNEPAQPVETEAKVALTSIDGAQFPILVINDVPADTTASPAASYRFFARLPNSNVWVHAADPRSNLTEPIVPTEHSEQTPSRVDVRVQVVWPHDGRGESVPAERASAVNIAVDLFAHGTTRSVPADFDPRLVLRVAEGNGPLREQDESGQLIAQASKITYSIDNRTYPRWVFNDVPVQPGRLYHFLVDVVEGVEMAYPSVWTHGHKPEISQSAPSIPPSCRP